MADNPERQIAAPLTNPENAPYFEAAKEGRLMVGKCNDCGEYHFYPRVLCPHCNSDKTEAVAARGTGVIYSHSTMRRGVPAPYTIAYVTLDEGVSMMTNIVDCDPGALKIGDKVRLVFRNAEDGTSVPMFAPA
jgi:uncharacterized OB-fold protein